MKRLLLSTILLGTIAVPVSAQTTEPEATETNSDPRFTCQLVEGDYTVTYHPLSQPGESYPWAVPGELGGGWTPERRCNEIARRLESYRPDGLVELGLDRVNNYDTICVTTEDNPACRIVLTIPPGRDPEIVRDRVFDNVVAADSGNRTEGVTTLMGDEPELGDIEDLIGIGDRSSGSIPRRSTSRFNGIDLRPFLDRFDGGTGTQLRETRSAEDSDNPRFNPENFR